MHEPDAKWADWRNPSVASGTDLRPPRPDELFNVGAAKVPHHDPEELIIPPKLTAAEKSAAKEARRTRVDANGEEAVKQLEAAAKAEKAMQTLLDGRMHQLQIKPMQKLGYAAANRASTAGARSWWSGPSLSPGRRSPPPRLADGSASEAQSGASDRCVARFRRSGPSLDRRGSVHRRCTELKAWSDTLGPRRLVWRCGTESTAQSDMPDRTFGGEARSYSARPNLGSV